MPPSDEGSRSLPRFGGEPALWATFLTRFIGYCLLHVKGVDALHALEENDHSQWYPRLRHTGEGNTYKFDPDSDDQYDEMYAQQVNADACPAYSEATNATGRKAARNADKRARRLLMAALKEAVHGCNH